MSDPSRPGWLAQLRERGVLRVAASYAVIAWLLLQIADVTFEPLGLPGWAMPALIVTALLGFPVAVLLAWFLELGDHGITRDSATAEATRPRVHGVRRYADVVIIGALLVAVAVLLVRQSDIGKPPPPAKPSLAVLPFANLSGDPEQDYFSDGLAEEVLDRLGQVPGLMVVARSSSFSFRDKDIDVRTIAERLGVAAVLEGAVRRDGKRLRLSAKLVDGRTGYQLWSGSFDREVTDVFAVQEELARAVIDAIVPLARGDTVVAGTVTPPTTSLTAYDMYLLGRAAQTQRGPMGNAGLNRSVEFFEQALEADPGFARAQGALANSLVLLVTLDPDEQVHAEQLRRAETAVYKALSMDPNVSEAQVAYANLLRLTERAGAEDAYQRAIDLNPNNAEAWHSYAVYLGNVEKRYDESDRAMMRALELDPRSAVTWANYLGKLQRDDPALYPTELDRAAGIFADVPEFMLGFVSDEAMHGRPKKALEFWLAAHARGRDPNVPQETARFSSAFPWRNVDDARAVSIIDEALEDPALRRSPLKFMLLDLLGTAGDETRVRELIAELKEIHGAEQRDLNARIAFWASVFGRYDEAAPALALAEPIPEEPQTGGLGSSIVTFQALPAKLRVLRATGRQAEADELASHYLAKWRDSLRANPAPEGIELTDLAALAANEGHRDEAVELLRRAMDEADLPFFFRPSLPWFRSLEGHPGYDALLGERAARVERLRTEMRALEANASKESKP
jgi:TolB-like protein/tetratricopeptide (TPR) repeat protein